MSETQGNSELSKPVETVTEQKEETRFLEPLQTKVSNILASWQLKVGLVGAVLVTIALTVFFWQHEVAALGMRLWSRQAGATPIECMVKDTNGDQYVSCSAILNDQVVPLECGASIFNVGCRINYGAAAIGARKSRD
ncbi:hypothetical protein PN466_25335 [Roseofilum reptotaenium CS-1145]|uniref:hypothetical protein n=1 Tax=Roseofilum reptotaenium TaxID=1233427 RepID=UPI000AD148A0|nr:hypothetical protein [Roseofilum reptotaenium]MDB9520273.1 hypothetical protein [Roseofilum reptotaenium CS-1145]